MSKKPFPEEKKKREQYEATAANERLHASGGVCPQTVLC